MTYENMVTNYMSNKVEFYLNPASEYIEPFRIFGPVYYVGDKRVCVHLLDTGDGLILLDAGFPQTVHMLTESIYRLGFDPHDIRLIVLTHGHYDHFGAAMQYKKLYGCEIALSRTDRDLLRDNPDAALRSWSPLAPWIVLPEIDRVLEDGEHIRLGCMDILCRSIPGHTPGAMAFFAEVSEDGGKFYRFGLYGGVGANGVRKCFLKQFGLPMTLQSDMLCSLEKMSEEHVDIMLGNHPVDNDTLKRRERQLAGEKYAFLEPEAWPAFLKKHREAFEKIFAEEQAEEAENV